MTREARDAPQFYLTAPSACPYLPGQQERKIFTHLVGKRAAALNDLLTQTGFRRSQTIAYRPACESCRACVSVRVLVDDFRPSASQRRTIRANADLLGVFVTPKPTNEHYILFRSYLDARHPEGGMADMSSLDFAMMVEDTHIDTVLTEYRPRSGVGGQQSSGPLLGVCLTDRLADGLSLVYSFYAPNVARRSLGSYIILDHIEKARRLGLPHVYLGYWVEGSKKMGYKASYLPQERLGLHGWSRVERYRSALACTAGRGWSGRGRAQHSTKFTAKTPGSSPCIWTACRCRSGAWWRRRYPKTPDGARRRAARARGRRA